MTTPSPRRRIVHIITQVLLLALAAIDLFFLGVVVSRAWWLSLFFLVAVAATVYGIAIEKTRWLIAGATVSVAASIIAIRLRSPIEDNQPVVTAVASAVLILVWWISRPRFGRRPSI